MSATVEAPYSILVIDDDPEVRSSMQAVLESLGFNSETASTAEDGIRLLHKGTFDLAICDLRLPGASGMDVLRECSRSVPIILMTAFGDKDIAIKAAELGAFDYLAKPILPDELIFTLRKFQDLEYLKRENRALKDTISSQYGFGNIIAKSDSFKAVFDTVKRLSQFTTTVMITGESGTGKELLARAVHENSPRRGRPFVAINCGAIPETLMESELFGHKRGAFTDAIRDKKGLFEEAHGGTLFLDEVGELPLHLQVKLLRALQERSIRKVGDDQLVDIDVRIISATLRNLEEDAKAGRFREDLFYRLNVVSIHLPPLRDRPDDIPLLVNHFIAKHSKRLGVSPKTVPQDVYKALLRYDWRGNARELENCIERALVLSLGDDLELDALPERVLAAGGYATPLQAPLVDDGNLSVKQKTRALEIDLIRRALEKTRGNRTHAAKVLEISHRALLYKLKEYELGDE